MPIFYRVENDGHFIKSFAIPPVSKEEFVDYELAHAIDKSIKPPACELLSIYNNAFRNITPNDMKQVFDRRNELNQIPHPHRCAIAVNFSVDSSWDVVEFYWGMVMLHRSEAVHIFDNNDKAIKWLGIQDTS